MQYDVCLSFAGEDRQYVKQVADRLRFRGVRVFYDDYERVDLWGKDLYAHLDYVYRKAARYCVVFASAHYARKLWTTHERRSSQARAFGENTEYILPARFDDTDIPGIPPTIGYVDLRTTSAEDLADLITEKLGTPTSGEAFSNTNRQYFFYYDKGIIPEVSWPTSPYFDTGQSFQLIPIGFKSQRISEIVAVTIGHIKKLFQNDEGYWTHGEDREFDRTYATTSVLNYLLQMGFPQTHPIVAKALSYLDKRMELSIDNRANIFFQIIFHRISQQNVVAFLQTLRAYQQNDSTSPLNGSFLLSQGPETQPKPTTEHWQTHRYHSEGASFHACHIADVLLHLHPDFTDARKEANSILDGIASYIDRNFRQQAGFLLNLQSQPSKITLLAYALTKPLRIPLPPNWLECTKTVIDDFKEEQNWLLRAFGIMNLHYMSRLQENPDLRLLTHQYVGNELESIWKERDRFLSDARDVSILGRSLLYGYRLINSDASAYFLRAVENYVKQEGN